MIAGVWMKSHLDQYEPYMTDQTVEEYCNSHIDVLQKEIEEPGLRAIYDAVFQPAGMTVEILCLDRSPGEEVQAIRYESGKSSSDLTVRLLFTP